MNSPSTPLRRFIVALGCSATLALIALPAAQAAEAAPHATEAKALPVSTSIKKGAPGAEGGPYVVEVKNTSSEALKVKATVIQSVATHSRARKIEHPEVTIAAGATHDIADLAVDDQVVLTADGYAKLEVRVPAAN